MITIRSEYIMYYVRSAKHLYLSTSGGVSRYFNRINGRGGISTPSLRVRPVYRAELSVFTIRHLGS